MQILGHPCSRNVSPTQASPTLLCASGLGTGWSDAIERLPLPSGALPCGALHESQEDALAIGPCSPAVARAANGTVQYACIKDMSTFGWTVRRSHEIAAARRAGPAVSSPRALRKPRLASKRSPALTLRLPKEI